MRVATELDEYNQPTGRFVILDGKYSGVVTNDFNQYCSKNWLGRLEDIEWISDLASKKGEIVQGRDKEFEEGRNTGRLRQLIGRATSDPVTKSLNGWNSDLTKNEYDNDINNRYNTTFNKNCSKLQR